jgi:hypothetical protein
MRTLLYCAAALALAASAGAARAAEIITVRSGQSGGVPGAVGALDDIVTYNPWGNPVAAPVLPTAFVAADFAATVAGSPATVIAPVAPWMGGLTAPLSDPLARWINFAPDPTQPFPPGRGAPGSALYAVPFWINTATITNATLTVEGGVDDVLGDAYSNDGPNFDGLYINDIPSGLSTLITGDFNFGFPTTHFQVITTKVQPGQNYLFFYQRDLGAGVSGLIFSATIEVVPEPGSIGLAATGALFAFGRRRGR